MDTRATMDILKRGYNKINSFNNVIINTIYLKEFYKVISMNYNMNRS